MFCHSQKNKDEEKKALTFVMRLAQEKKTKAEWEKKKHRNVIHFVCIEIVTCFMFSWSMWFQRRILIALIRLNKLENVNLFDIFRVMEMFINYQEQIVGNLVRMKHTVSNILTLLHDIHYCRILKPLNRFKFVNLCDLPYKIFNQV